MMRSRVPGRPVSKKPQRIHDEKGHHDQANQIEDAIHALPYESARPMPSAANRTPTSVREWEWGYPTTKALLHEPFEPPLNSRAFKR